jgi:hypothetical protein
MEWNQERTLQPAVRSMGNSDGEAI